MTLAGDKLENVTFPLRQRRVVSVVLLAGYVVSFPILYPVIDHLYFPLGLLPIMAAGLLLGFWPAIVTALVVSIIHFGQLAGPLGTPLGEAAVVSFPLFTLLVGATIGYVRDTRVSLARTRDDLERKNERLDELVSVLSHDLRNPLNVAQGRLEMAQETGDLDHLQHVDRAHVRMEELITKLLSLARSEKELEELESVHLASLVDTCWANVETEAARLAIETEATIQADAFRVQQLLENLFRNAVEHSENDVTITVGSVHDGFYVEDDGPGIPPEERDQVVESGYSSTEDGTGFGLAIVKRVCEAHGWEVQLTDSEAGGLRIEITDVTLDAGE